VETYSYEAATRDGGVVTGTVEAVNEHFAINRIQDMGYFPLKVNKSVEGGGGISRFFPFFIHAKVREKDVMGFTYQLGVLLDAGFPLDRSLSILSELTEKKVFRDIVKELVAQIRSGKSFSDSLLRFPSVFPLFYVNMIKAGEAGGFLDETISQMADYLEESQSLKDDIRSAIIYPLVLSLVGGVAVIVLLTFVVPKFTRIFADMGETLPLPTVILLSISNGLRNYWEVLLLLIVAVFFAARRYLKTKGGMRSWDKARFRLPLFGKLYKEAAVSRFARTLGTLLGSGVPLLNALQIVRGTLGSESISGIIDSVREDVRKGRGISEPLKKNNIFPPIAVHMVTVGEETGKLDEMLAKIAKRFDLEVRTTVKRMLALLEPALILIMGLIVGFIVIAMLLAIFSINELPF
jgi:general secretion pathway protein F